MSVCKGGMNKSRVELLTEVRNEKVYIYIYIEIRVVVGVVGVRLVCCSRQCRA